jgi:hypothetical protein
MEAGNVFTDQLHGRPAPGELFLVGAPAGGGDVVQECFKPHVGDVGLVEGKLNTPIDVGARNGKVFQTSVHKRDNFVSDARGLNEIRTLAIKHQELLLEVTHLEEVVLFLQHLNRATVDLADLLALKFVTPLCQVRRGLVFLAAHAVETLVLTLIDKAFVVQEGEKLLDCALVALFRGADEVVISEVQSGEQRLPRLLHQAISPLFGFYPIGQRGPHDLLTVLICSGQKPGVDAGVPHPPRESISCDLCVGMPNMRHVIHIENRCRDQERIGPGCGHRGSILRGVPDTFLIQSALRDTGLLRHHLAGLGTAHTGVH